MAPRLTTVEEINSYLEGRSREEKKQVIKKVLGRFVRVEVEKFEEDGKMRKQESYSVKDPEAALEILKGVVYHPYTRMTKKAEKLIALAKENRLTKSEFDDYKNNMMKMAQFSMKELGEKTMRAPKKRKWLTVYIESFDVELENDLNRLYDLTKNCRCDPVRHTLACLNIEDTGDKILHSIDSQKLDALYPSLLLSIHLMENSSWMKKSGQRSSAIENLLPSYPLGAIETIRATA